MAVSAEIMARKTGIGGRGPAYSRAMVDNSKIEEQIGLALAKDSRVAEFATEITKKSKVKQYGELDQARKEHINDEANTFSGARAFKEGWGTLGGSVFAVMAEIEKDKATKSKYSVSNSDNHPYYPKGKKKPEFDKPMNELLFADLPVAAKKYLTTAAAAPPPAAAPAFNYNILDKDTKLAMLKNYRFQSTKAIRTATKLRTDIRGGVGAKGNIQTTLANLKNNPDNEAARVAAIQAIRKEIIATTVSNEKAQLGALLDIVVDKHASGHNTNLVSLDKDDQGHEIDNEKNRWIKDTIKAGKPIISGPSGHTLRYLNFWSEKRQNDQEAAAGPSLQAARLVMMANLMPPKHHSYDEIMTSSIGITDTIDTLKYEHKASYKDLGNQTGDAQAVAQNAYVNSGAEETDSNNLVADHREREINDDVENRKQQQADIEAIIAKLKTPEGLRHIRTIRATLGIPNPPRRI